MINNLVVDEERIRKNLELTGGAIFSEALLLELVRTGKTREEAYKIVQRIAHYALDRGESFQQTVLADYDLLTLLGEEQLERLFSLKHALRHVDAIYQRLGL